MKIFLSTILFCICLGSHAATTLSSTNFALRTNVMTDADLMMGENTNRPIHMRTVAVPASNVFSNRTGWGIWNFDQQSIFTNGLTARESIISSDGASMVYMNGNITPFFNMTSNAYQCVLFYPGVSDGGGTAFSFDTPSPLAISDLFKIANYGVTKLSIGPDGDVASGGSFRGGHKSSDGTAGVTSLSGGAVFKDGLFIGGLVGGGGGGAGYASKSNFSFGVRNITPSGYTVTSNELIYVTRITDSTNRWTAMSAIASNNALLVFSTDATGATDTNDFSSFYYQIYASAVSGAGGGGSGTNDTNYVRIDGGFVTNLTAIGTLAVRGGVTATSVQATNYYSADNTAGTTTTAHGFTMKQGLVTAFSPTAGGTSGSNYLTAAFKNAHFTNGIYSGNGAQAWAGTYGMTDSEITAVSTRTNGGFNYFWMTAEDQNQDPDGYAGQFRVYLQPSGAGKRSNVLLQQADDNAARLAAHHFSARVDGSADVNYSMVVDGLATPCMILTPTPNSTPAFRLQTPGPFADTNLIHILASNITLMTLSGSGTLTVPGFVRSAFTNYTNGMSMSGGIRYFPHNITFTNGAERSTIYQTVGLQAGAGDFAKCEAWLDEDADGTYELKVTSAELQITGGAATTFVQQQMVFEIAANTRFYFTNTSTGGATVFPIRPGRWVK